MKYNIKFIMPVYLLVITGLLVAAFGSSKIVSVLSENTYVKNRKTVVVDAGHGGVDGGATSCTGVLESKFNLEIALKLRDLLNLLGINTVMIRETDCSVYTEGTTISQKKISDLKQRVTIANTTENAVLVSIHQNLFSDSKYSGAQVFYAPTEGSAQLAKILQNFFVNTVNPESNRQAKRADAIYLMQHIACPGVLIECGFLSNPSEEYLLRTPEYQNKLCCIIASTLSTYLHNT